ncbi:M4 family metallopeptidase [Spirilliplanes yamanashiensis]|uniref:Zinc metalloprotease n=1 Tax=Spirilliplanes yamanashiensis TaxID=42233 RepID=A0A8J3Y9A9_9ACTN|nr:M4 family metallopeptidase [Spirilliplanes yamanashiensis]MDP9817571.1 Zn-dependent metalloprotease [Spirilliplanes yamanashiensis]GIJ04381.1 zinc metalloprotease [Spirilliplanes yamanashiensis]
MQRTILTRAAVAVAATGALAAAAAAALPASAEQQAPSTPAAAPSAPATPAETAAANADAAVAAPASSEALRRAAGDSLTRTGITEGPRGTHYVRYARTHEGLPVIGGDVVVVTDADGAVTRLSVVQPTPVTVDTKPRVSREDALATARKQLATVTEASEPELVVHAQGDTPRLAWEAVVDGAGKAGDTSRLHVWVDAESGAVIGSFDEIMHATATGSRYGAVQINTTKSGSRYVMADPARPGLRCGKWVDKTAAELIPSLTSSDDVWGGAGSEVHERACVDALYGAQTFVDMLKTEAFGKRQGVLGNGTTPPIFVALNDVNAYWDGSSVTLGHTDKGEQVTSIDIVAHELAHAIYSVHGGLSYTNEDKAINEASSDIFGALAEKAADHPDDDPDYQVGEEVDLKGDGPIRYMNEPKKLPGHVQCWNERGTFAKPHLGAGLLNHWFVLAAEGSSGAADSFSPTCDGSRVSGIGIEKAGEIFYNALLSRSGSWTHVDVREGTLHAAVDANCAAYATIKAAWDAVQVPAGPEEPGCVSDTAARFAVTVSPDRATVGAGGAVTAAVRTTTTAGKVQSVRLKAEGLPAGATAAFSPPWVKSGQPATMTVTTAPDTPLGTYPVTVVGSGVRDVSVTFNLVVAKATGCSATNDQDLEIPDADAMQAVESAITLIGCERAPSKESVVKVSVVHPYRGDVVIELIAPDAVKYRLKRNGPEDSDANVNATYTVDLKKHKADGTWRLSVRDVYSGDTGYIDSWSLTL